MSVLLEKVESSAELPASADVVVIGAGIVGVFSAYYLAQRGLRVALLEKGYVGAEQSARNWGWCRQQNRDARELPISTFSLDLWDRFAEESGEDTGFRRCGLLYLSNDDEEIARWAKWRDFAKTVGVTTHMLDAKGAMARAGMTARSWKGGVFSPSDGTADPSKAAPAVAQALKKLGGTVHQQCAARGLELSGGAVSGVVTEKGTIRTSAVVMAGGAWASSFCRQLGIRFPQAAVRSSILSVSAPAADLPAALHTAGVSLTQRANGGYTLAISGRGRVDPTGQMLRFASQFVPMFAKRWRSLSPGGLEGVRGGHETLAQWRLDAPTPMEQVRVLDPKVDKTSIALTHSRALALIPALASTTVTHSWAGYIDSTPDGVPAIGETQQVRGLVLAAGFSGHGFGIGPGAGYLVADVVTGAESVIDPKPYDPARFASSSWGKVADF